jgi:hypothetical protein
VAAILAAMESNGNEAGLRRHEARTLGHEIEHLILLVGRKLHCRDLSDNEIAFLNFGHNKIPPRDTQRQRATCLKGSSCKPGA